MTHVPDKLTILTPMPTVLPRGVQAKGPFACGPLGENLSVRVSQEDNRIIIAACNVLGMKRAEFIRWCAVHTARELMKG